MRFQGRYAPILRVLEACYSDIHSKPEGAGVCVSLLDRLI